MVSNIPVELKRVASMVDLVVAVIVTFVVVIPPRAVKGKPAAGGDADSRLALAFAQARAAAHPEDAGVIADLSRRLSEVGFTDWAVQEAAAGAARNTAVSARAPAPPAHAFSVKLASVVVRNRPAPNASRTPLQLESRSSLVAAPS